ncbi:hypothetical protein halTADL_1678 [Halohasta litchfieldiae]|jgi:hypothetical protein|uniref:RNase_H superfamily protein n=1 Tax=Halohasta litchfieldiae TaxID=1073996 RepID=A0A1H6UQS5_9EURY|nr:hypothetical protein [Halohasta litchfieldiae]ATW88433.1 hypothetical protein halTADL_1678 [Halohasta litchfieldiae]SEI94689.1 hypothetical protein SAMN05444271_11313 [Halohasta litchfieldiae]
MGNLDPVAFDIETSGLGEEAVITVAGIAHELGEVIILNTAGREANSSHLEQTLLEESVGSIEVIVTREEEGLLEILTTVSHNRLDDDKHYLTAYNGETWNGGFDLPFVRTACISHDIDWPFPNLAYADVFEFVDRFDTNDKNDLVGVYDELVQDESCDPFDDSKAAVDAFEGAEWESLLLHNLADIQRTRELAVLAESYVPRSDFKMKNLNPPGR